MSMIETDLKSLKPPEVIQRYSPKELVESLSFQRALNYSKQLLEYDVIDTDLISYSIDLIIQLKKTHSDKWSWKHEAYLGHAYIIQGWDYDKQFDAFERAAQMSGNPPPEVLLRLAINWSCPGVYKERMDERKAIEILEKVVKEKPLVEALTCLINLYEHVGEQDKADKLKSTLEESEHKQIYDRGPYLDFFDEYSE